MDLTPVRSHGFLLVATMGGGEVCRQPRWLGDERARLPGFSARQGEQEVHGVAISNGGTPRPQLLYLVEVRGAGITTGGAPRLWLLPPAALRWEKKDPLAQGCTGLYIGSR